MDGLGGVQDFLGGLDVLPSAQGSPLAYQPPQVGASQANPIGGFNPGAGLGNYSPIVPQDQPQDQPHPGIVDLSNKLAAAFAHPNPSPEIQALRDQATQLYAHGEALRNQALGQPLPQAHGPNTRDLAIAAFLGLVGGNSALASTAKGYQGGQDQARQEALQQLQQSQQQGLSAAQGIDQQATRLDQQAGNMQQQANTDRSFAQNQQNIDNASAEKKREFDLTQKQVAYAKGLDTLNKIQTAYNGAKTEGALKSIAGRWRSFDAQQQAVDPNYVPTAPDQTQVGEDFRTKTAHSRQMAENAWETALSHYTNEFGQVSEHDANFLEEQRRSIATDNQIPLKSLRFVPTLQTLKDKARDDAKARFDQTFTRLSNNHRDNLAVAQGHLQVAQGMLRVAQENGNINLFRAAQSQYEFAQHEGRDATGKALFAINKDIADTQAQLKTGKDQPGAKIEDLQKLERSLDGLKAQRAALQTQGQEYIVDPVLGMSAPNPAYNPGAGANAYGPGAQGQVGMPPQIPGNGFSPPSLGLGGAQGTPVNPPLQGPIGSRQGGPKSRKTSSGNGVKFG